MGEGDSILKRMSFTSTLSSNAGGSIPITAFTTDTVRSNPATEWASFAARYQAYRVRAMRVQFIATHPTVDAVATSHAALIVSDSTQGQTPTSTGQVFADERSIVRETFRRFSYTTDWSRNPNAKLWNPTNAAIPVANQFQVNVITLGTLANSTLYYELIFEFDVELKASQ